MLPLVAESLRANLVEGDHWFRRRLDRIGRGRRGRKRRPVLVRRTAGATMAAAFLVTAAALTFPLLAFSAGSILIPFVVVGVCCLHLVVVGAIRRRVIRERPRVEFEAFRAMMPPELSWIEPRRLIAARIAIAEAFGMEPDLLLPDDDGRTLQWLLDQPTAEEILDNCKKQLSGTPFELEGGGTADALLAGRTAADVIRSLCTRPESIAHA